MRTTPGLPDALRLSELQRAQRRSQSWVSRTPMFTMGSLSARLGGEVVLKAENLQRTGSFKLRGALNKLHTSHSAAGVVTGSAGNHAQALAYAARTIGIPCEVFMPADAPIDKAAAVRAFGGEVHSTGDSVDECIELALARADETGFLFVHPFDDLGVIAGQGGVGVEILEERPEIGSVVVPIGGGGLIAGVAAALRQVQPKARIVGVQAERCSPFPQSLRVGSPVSAERETTIADGISIKRPGEITLPLVDNLVDDIVTVSDSEIAEAMALLLERSKLVVEGAGAAALAAVIGARIELDPEQANVVVLSGGNVDIGLLAAIAARQQALRGRRLRLSTRISDRPGGLARLLAAVAEARANLIAVEHVRESSLLDVRETGVELTMETRGEQHAEEVRAALAAAGYETNPS